MRKTRNELVESLGYVALLVMGGIIGFHFGRSPPAPDQMEEPTPHVVPNVRPITPPDSNGPFVLPVFPEDDQPTPSKGEVP